MKGSLPPVGNVQVCAYVQSELFSGHSYALRKKIGRSTCFEKSEDHTKSRRCRTGEHQNLSSPCAYPNVEFVWLLIRSKNASGNLVQPLYGFQIWQTVIVFTITNVLYCSNSLSVSVVVSVMLLLICCFVLWHGVS